VQKHRSKVYLSAFSVLMILNLASTAVADSEVRCQEDQDLTDYRKYESGGDITWGDYRALPAVPAIFSSERFKITVNGTVNINRTIYEVRECNWFGINCWYEKRVRNNYVRPENVPLLWIVPKNEKPVAGDLADAVNQSGVTKEPIKDLSAYWGDAPLTTGRTLRAIVGQDSIARIACSGETSPCSVGAYQIKVEIDSGPRALRLLQELRLNRIGYSSIMSENVLNSNLRTSSPPVKACAAEALLEQARRFFGSAAGASERQKLLQEAVNLNPTNKSAQTLLGSTYLETGQFDEARKTATATAGDNEKLIQVGQATPKTFVELAQNYATLAEVGWRETAGDSTKAGLDAVGYLRLARERLIDRLEKHSRDQKEKEFTSDVARSLLTTYSSRLSEVLARLGTEETLLQAVSAPNDTISRLPLRYSDVTPFEVDATADTIIAIRNREPILSDRSWQTDQRLLPLTSHYALTPYAFDSRGKSDKGVEVAAFRYGDGRVTAHAVERMIGSADEPVNVFSGADQCISAVARWGQPAAEAEKDPAVAIYHGDNDKAVVLPSSGKATEIAGLRAAVSVRGNKLRIANVLQHPTKKDTWVFSDGHTKDDGHEINAKEIAEPADRVQVRASPNATFFGIGFEKNGSTKWRLVSHFSKDGNHEDIEVPLTCGPENAETLDDIAITSSEIIGIGANCPALKAALPGPGSKQPVRLTEKLDAQRDLSPEVREIFKDRRASFAWISVASAPFAVLSWSEKNAAALSSTYKLHVFSSKAAGASGRAQQIYSANVAEWAAPSAAPLACKGVTPKWAFERHKFRVTNVTLAKKDEQVGEEIASSDRPKIELVAVGNVGSLSALTSNSSRSAKCNAADYRDIQVDSRARYWAASSQSNAIVRLNGLDGRSCESAFRTPSTTPSSRIYKAPSSAKDPLEIFDIDADDNLTSFTRLGSEFAKADSFGALAVCSLSDTGGSSCSAKELISGLGAPSGSEIRVLNRDISTDSRSRSDTLVRRPTGVAISEPPSAAFRKVRFFGLPLSGPSPSLVVSAPEAARPIAVLHHGKIKLGLFVLGSTLKALDEKGVVGEVSIPAGWTWGSELRVLLNGDRMLASRMSSASKIEVLTVAVKSDGTLSSSISSIDYQSTTSDLARSVNFWPILTQGGRLESIAVSAQLDRVLIPKTPTTANVDSWASANLGEGEAKIPRAGAGLPLMISQNRLLIIGAGDSLVEGWELQQ
jgi:hypothetical protein